MPVPSPRNKILPARGNFADLNAEVASLLDGEICYAIDQDQYYQNEGGTLVSVGATKAQGILADSAVQPGDNVSDLTNDANYITLAEVPGDLVTSVNTQIGDVVLDADDIDDSATTNKFATAAQLGLADTSVQPGDNISDLTNDANYIDAAGAPVQSVNTQTGDVVLGAADVGAATAAQGALADSAVQPTDSIDILADVDTSTVAPTDGQALVWDNVAGQWEPGTVSGGGGATVIDDLTDVDTSTIAPTDGQVLTWVDVNSQWEPAFPAVAGTAVFGWDHDDDTYGLYLPGTSLKVSDLTGIVDIDVQSRIRRCLIDNPGQNNPYSVQYYLDADNSNLRSGDWLRIVETEALDTSYTGTISESTNSLLRAGVPEWAARTFNAGQRVTYNGFLWECIATTTTATPAAGTVSSNLTGTDGQVVVEIPAFSVRYGFLNGVHTREVKLGCSNALIAQGFQPHPAFIKTDGSYKDAFYVGAYHTFNNNQNSSSVSGEINTRTESRAAFRADAQALGTGWHVWSYLELAAIQLLMVCEYQDHNSQRAVGNGANSGSVYGVTTGQSDGDGNHSVNSTGNASASDNYMAYRGIENLYGRSSQWVDGINVYNRTIYLSNDQTAFNESTSAGYEFYAQVPPGSNAFQKELHPLADVFLPSGVVGGSSTTYLGDPITTTTQLSWNEVIMGGSSNFTSRCGAFFLYMGYPLGYASSSVGSRLAYAIN